MCYLCLHGSNFNEFKNHISFWNDKSYACIACQNFLVICEVYQNFRCSAFYSFCFALLFYLCFALLCFYVSLHYVLPALQFNCACLIFMNMYMYVLLVSVCNLVEIRIPKKFSVCSVSYVNVLYVFM